MPISPTMEGFRATFRRPALALAEITWRWCVGATAGAVLLFGLFEYLDTLPVTNGELLFLRTRHPYFVAAALARIFRGTVGRLTIAGLLAGLLLALLWMVAGALGRIATVRGLLEYFRERNSSALDESQEDAAASTASSRPEGSSFWTLVRLNALRAAVAVAAVIGFVGAAIVAGYASPDSNPQPGLAFLLFVPLAGLICLFWWALNWILSLAALFAVRDGAGTGDAISAAVGFYREHAGAVSAVTAWTGLLHLVAFVAATTLVSMPVGLVALVAWRLVVLVLILITVGYFASVEWMYTARLAGYVCIAEMPQEMLATLPPTPVSPPGGAQVAPIPLQTTIDRDEPILSDVPGLTAET